jgi:hypothetical protein
MQRVVTLKLTINGLLMDEPWFATTGRARMISPGFPYQKQRRRVLGREIAHVEWTG